MRTMILALVLMCVACGGEGLAPDPDGGTDAPSADASGPLAGHALVGRWVRVTTGSATTEHLIGADGSLSTRRTDTSADTGCALAFEQRFAVTVTGSVAGYLMRAAGPYQETVTETCPGSAPTTTTVARSFRGTPEPYSVSGDVLTLSTATYRRVP